MDSLEYFQNKEEIENTESVIFDFPEENFFVEYNYFENRWIAQSYDEELEDNIIIIEDLQKGIKFDEESIELFGGYILNQDLFRKYKKLI